MRESQAFGTPPEPIAVLWAPAIQSPPLLNTNSYGAPELLTDVRGFQTKLTYGPIAGPEGDVLNLYPTDRITTFGTPSRPDLGGYVRLLYRLVTTATDVDNNFRRSE